MGNTLIIIGFVVLLIGLSPMFIKKKAPQAKISEWSYKRYANFYGKMELADKDFYTKIDKIYHYIVNEKKYDIKEIAELSGCTYDECILKIRYLKNKRKIGDYYIDHINGIIKDCPKEQQELLDKYKQFIYVEHLQIEEIAKRDPNTTLETLSQKMEQVKIEVKYLIDLDLLNGVKYNEVDDTLIYYTIEKHSKEKDLISVECPTCGALNDVDRNSKVKCVYCGNIIEGTNFKVPEKINKTVVNS